MLDGRNDSLLLDALDGEGTGLGLENGIRAKALPIASAERLSAQRANCRTQVDICPLSAKLFADGNGASIDQGLVERSTCGDAGRESSHIIG